MSTSLPEGLTPGHWTLDPAHTAVTFAVRHAGISKTRGSFGDVAGTFTVRETLEDSSLEATVKIASIDTGNEQRDDHLRSPEFFDAETHPEMTFTSTKISEKELVGDLTLHGETREVTFDLTYEGAAADPFGTYRSGFSGTTEISRKDFGLTWNAALAAGGVLVGDAVSISIEAEFTAPATA